MTPDQCRAARALINWSQSQLAEKAGVARATLADFETGKRRPIANNLNALKKNLELGGVVFLDENGGGPGVRLRKEG